MSINRVTVCEQRLATTRDHPGRSPRALNSRPIDETVVPAEYFKASLANLVFCYRSGNLVLLHLDFTGLYVGMTVVHERSARNVWSNMARGFVNS